MKEIYLGDTKIESARKKVEGGFVENAAFDDPTPLGINSVGDIAIGYNVGLWYQSAGGSPAPRLRDGSRQGHRRAARQGLPQVPAQDVDGGRRGRPPGEGPPVGSGVGRDAGDPLAVDVLARFVAAREGGQGEQRCRDACLHVHIPMLM